MEGFKITTFLNSPITFYLSIPSILSTLSIKKNKKVKRMADKIYQVLDRIEDETAVVDIGPNASSLDFLQTVYRDPAQSMNRRMRAAIAALPFEHPKLAVTATLGPNSGFAAKLEAAIKRSRGDLIVIDAETVPAVAG
jgi:hypothetical protein